MYKPLKIKENLYYVGVNDRTKHLFENLWPLPQGVSYNSYLIDDEKTVLIDTVDICYSDVFFRKIASVLDERPIDYLVINHMEPDHSGSVEQIIRKYPEIKIIGNNRTTGMLEGFYGITQNIQQIKDGEELSIGKNILKFYLTPMVHWPETMMTYLPEAKAIFSGDAFGTFGTLDGGVLDTQLNIDRYRDEMIRYYSNIVGKYGSPVQSALKKLSDIPVEVICSTHGPVWTQPENVAEVISVYDKLSRYEPLEKGLVIAYGSMYGNTEQLAEAVATAAAENGIRDIVMHNVSKSHVSDIIRDIFKYEAFIVGSPTYNNKLYPAVENLLSAIENRNLRNRLFSYFGGHTWADATQRQFKEFFEQMPLEIVCYPVAMKQSPNDEILQQAQNLGKAMAERMQLGEPVNPQKITCH